MGPEWGWGGRRRQSTELSQSGLVLPVASCEHQSHSVTHTPSQCIPPRPHHTEDSEHSSRELGPLHTGEVTIKFVNGDGSTCWGTGRRMHGPGRGRHAKSVSGSGPCCRRPYPPTMHRHQEHHARKNVWCVRVCEGWGVGGGGWAPPNTHRWCRCGETARRTSGR
jgi:hypothetical protein